MSLLKKILVVLGGTSKERQVSLETGASCINSLKKSGYKVGINIMQIPELSFKEIKGDNKNWLKNFEINIFKIW